MADVEVDKLIEEPKEGKNIEAYATGNVDILYANENPEEPDAEKTA